MQASKSALEEVINNYKVAQQLPHKDGPSLRSIESYVYVSKTTLSNQLRGLQNRILKLIPILKRSQLTRRMHY